MAWIRSEEEVNKMIEDMKNKNRNKYITQGVTFNKDSESHMQLLKYCLMYSSSFSGLVKELIANRFNEVPTNNTTDIPIIQNNNTVATFNHNKGDLNNFKEENTQTANTGNFF